MSALQCILLSEFHPTVGPTIVCQAPSGFLSNEAFDMIDDYIITKPTMSGRLLTLTAMGFKFMGFPTLMDDVKFKRNFYLFNVCFIFLEGNDVSPFEPVLRKLAYSLKTIEKESELLSSKKDIGKIHDLINFIFLHLSTGSECIVRVDEANTIYLKLQNYLPSMKLLDFPEPHQVPLLVHLPQPSSIRHWDLALQKVLPFINGINHVKRISQLANARLEITQCCIQHLIYFNYARLIDIFQYSNIYSVTPRIQILAQNEEMQKKCMSFIVRQECYANSLQFGDIFRFYCLLNAHLTIKELCIENDTFFKKIDERKFIVFGVLNGFLRRVEKYPLLLPIHEKDTEFPFKGMLDGRTCFDNICCTLSQSAEFLEMKLRSSANQHIVILQR